MGNKNNQLALKDKTNQYILISLTVISAFLAVLFWRGSLTVYDSAGHVSLVRTIANDFWPRLSGWNGSELLGWPAGIFYPSFFHWLAATISFLTGVPIAVKLLISASIIVLPSAIYTFTKSVFEDKLWTSLTTIGLFLLLLLLPNFLGTGFRSLFQIGLLSNFFVLPIFLFFLASIHQRSSYLILGVLLALIVLTHIVAAFLAGIYLLLFIKVKFLSGSLVRGDLASYLKALGLAALLTAFFWIPFVANLEYTSVSRHVASYFWPNIAVFIVSLLVSLYAWRKREENLLALSLAPAFIALVAAVDAYLIRTNGTSFFLYQFHVYRFQPFAYLFLATTLIILISKFVKFDQWGFSKIGLIFGGFGLLVLLLLVKSPAVITPSKLEITNPQAVEGRFLETFRRAESDPFWYGLQTEVNAQNRQANWAYGLFTDSSPNGPFLGSLTRSLNPKAYPEGEGNFLEEKFIGAEKAGRFLDYLGINQLINLEEEEGKSVGVIKNSTAKYFNVEKASESRIFEIAPLPTKPIKKNWDKKVEKWWLARGEVTEIPYLVNGKKISEVSKNNSGKASVEIVKTNKNQTRFELKIDSGRQVPILAKISYFPYWQATDSDGNSIPIYRAAPNLMLFEAKGEVDLFYQEPSWIGWLYLISSTAFIATIFLIYRQKSRSK